MIELNHCGIQTAHTTSTKEHRGKKQKKKEENRAYNYEVHYEVTQYTTS